MLSYLKILTMIRQILNTYNIRWRKASARSCKQDTQYFQSGRNSSWVVDSYTATRDRDKENCQPL